MTECRRCKGELTKDEKRNCWVCLVCHPPQKEKPKEPEEKTKYLDVAMTEAMVREIVRDELENWHIQKPPVTVDEVKVMTTTEAVAKVDVVDPNWREQAKKLGVVLYHKTKDNVLKEIKEKLKGTKNDEDSQENEKNTD